MHRRGGELKAVRPFVFQRSVDFIEGFSPLMSEQTIRKGVLTKAVMVDGDVVVFSVRDAGRGQPGVAYELYSERNLDDAAVRSLERRISFFLSLEDDVGEFYSAAKRDPEYYPTVKGLWGLHHVKFPTLLEVSAWAIINQRIQRNVALKMKRALVERYGKSLEVEGVEHWAFPDYARMKDVTPRELAPLLKNQRKAERIGSLLDNFEDLDEPFLMTAPYQKAVERLLRVKGIGEWSAQFIMFRGLGRMESQRYSMKPLLEMMKEVYGPGRTLEDINRTYGKWCGYWSLYLWASRMAPRKAGGR